MIFRKRRGAAMIFAASLYLPIIFTNVPGRGDKIDVAESRLHPAIYLEPGIPREELRKL
jgi:hypothetical protein